MNRQLERALKENKEIEIIYMSGNEIFSKRTILVREVKGNYIKAFCLHRKQPRIFKLDSILAASYPGMRGRKNA
ncbi:MULTISPECIES: WYL domain-containing protein [Bacillaceae]|uniref:WYL domain-containing protein n=1 Tax=Bacillaceae TaxID=186817 RepID=UPI001E5BF7AF|nr:MULTISPECIES: WYL domain-containing protein [Bacillaceae]MCE4051560.1 WYL domain-containing protein [Bacillus sp. Au-Bac7]MCM3029935.1 WYL domain-containing protein [Niallia sp. MER 6]MDL0436230.1 WYL domain-containing protein [Niallia sp. SS-2023]UPO86774.1 WYL domain-containing protein [Niallia sp. Man26]